MSKIFIVEDDEIIANAIANHLKIWQMETKMAKDFQNIIAEMEAFKPNLVIMDIHLPYFNGFYWCAEIRKISKIQSSFSHLLMTI